MNLAKRHARSVGASEGDPQAQFRLALMYSGEDGYVTVPSGHEADKNFPEPKATSSLTLGQDEDSDDPYNTGSLGSSLAFLQTCSCRQARLLSFNARVIR